MCTVCVCVCACARVCVCQCVCVLPVTACNVFWIFTRLLRLSGTIGIAVVTWEVTPADSNTFVVNSGQAVFENGQETADIEIEVSSKCMHTCVHIVHAYVCAYSACMHGCVCQITRGYGVEREKE